MRTALLLALALLVPPLGAGPAALGRSGERRPASARAAPRPERRPGHPLGGLSEPVRLDTVARYLGEMGYSHQQVDEAQGWVRVRVRGENGVYDLYLVLKGSLVHLQIPRLLRRRADESGIEKLRATLLELNWWNLLGKYSWDPRDGEVRFAHALVVAGGLSFADLALAVSQSLTTVDEDMPRLRRSLAAVSPESEAAEAPPAGSGGRP